MALPAKNSALYRDITFIANRVLKAQELEMLQKLYESADQYGVGSVYRDGGTLNVKVTINGDNVSLDPEDPTKSMYVFLNGRFETFDAQVFSFAGVPAPKIFLNYTLYRVTYNDPGTINDPELIDVATNEKVAEAGQLDFRFEATDLSIDTTGVQPVAGVELAKNQHPILVYSFARANDGSLSLINSYERVKAEALGSLKNAGPVRVTHGAGLAVSPTDPSYIKLRQDLDSLLNIHPYSNLAHVDWQAVIDDIYPRLDAIKIPPPYIPPPAAPFLRLEPESLTFTGTPVNTIAEKTFELVNYGDGEGSYELVNGAAASDFTILGPVKGKIAPKSAITFRVQFAPKAIYAVAVGGPVSVNSLICAVTGTSKAAGADPLFQFEPAVLDFGYVPVGSFALKQVTIKNVSANNGTYQLSLPAGVFSVNDDGSSPKSKALAGGASTTIQLEYRPTAEQSDQVSVNFVQDGANSCILKGTGEHVPEGPLFRFLGSGQLHFAAKQNAAAKQALVIQNVGRTAGTPVLVFQNSKFSVVAAPGLLAPNATTTVVISLDTAQTGTHTGTLSFQANGSNGVDLSAVVAANGAVFQLSPDTWDFGSVAYAAGKQTKQFSVQNTGDAAGTPQLAISQAQPWFAIESAPGQLAAGASANFNVTFTPSAAMSQPGYPAVTGTLTVLQAGSNVAALQALATGPQFVIDPATYDAGVVEFNATKDVTITVKNTGGADGSVHLSVVGAGWSVVTAMPLSVAAGASADAVLRFTNNDAAFAAKYSAPAPATLYEFNASVNGASNVGLVAAQARSKNTRRAAFSPFQASGLWASYAVSGQTVAPAGTSAIVPIQLPDVLTNPGSSFSVISVVNVGNAPGKPNFVLGATANNAPAGLFQITREGADTDIAPGQIGTYKVTATGAYDSANYSRTYDLDQGGFTFAVKFSNQGFITRFVSPFVGEWDPVSRDLDLGVLTATYMGQPYMKYLTLGVVRNDSPDSQSLNIWTNGPAEAWLGDSSNRTKVLGPIVAANSKLPVQFVITYSGDGAGEAVINATCCENPIRVRWTWASQAAPAVPANTDTNLQVVGYCTTPDGQRMTTVQQFVGRYVSRPAYDPTSQIVIGGY